MQFQGRWGSWLILWKYLLELKSIDKHFSVNEKTRREIWERISYEQNVFDTMGKRLWNLLVLSQLVFFNYIPMALSILGQHSNALHISDIRGSVVNAEEKCSDGMVEDMAFKRCVKFGCPSNFVAEKEELKCRPHIKILIWMEPFYGENIRVW